MTCHFLENEKFSIDLVTQKSLPWPLFSKHCRLPWIILVGAGRQGVHVCVCVAVGQGRLEK